MYKHPFFEKATLGGLSIGSNHLGPKEDKLRSSFESGDKAVFISALALKPEIDQVQRNGSPLLNLCVQKGYTEMAEALLKAGVDVNKVDFENRTALQMAIASGQTNLVRMITQTNQKAANPKDVLITPLHTAALFGNIDSIEILLAAKADPNAKDYEGKTPLHLAIQTNNIPTVKILIDKTNLSSQDNHGTTPLIEAVKMGEVDVVSMLLNADTQGKALDLRDSEGYNAIYWSVVSQKLDIFQFLINSGISVIPQKKDDTFTTLLHVAARAGAPEFLELLRKSDANQKDSHNTTPLLSTVKALKHDENNAKHLECMRLLLAQGADPNAMDKTESCIHFCVKNGFVDALLILLQAEADPDLPDGEGLSPAAIAVNKHIENLSKKEAGLYSPILDRQMVQCVQALATHHADLDSRNRFGQTLMHLCVHHVNTTMGTTLLDAGAHPLKKDNFGNTPIHVAAKDPRNRDKHQYLFGYPMIQECMSTWWTYKRWSMWRSLTIFVLFLVLVTALSLVEVTGDDYAAFGLSSGMRQLVIERQFNDKTFPEISNTWDVWDWSKNNFIPAVCPELMYNVNEYSYSTQNL